MQSPIAAFRHAISFPLKSPPTVTRVLAGGLLRLRLALVVMELYSRAQT
jgi:hypothetical protein